MQMHKRARTKNISVAGEKRRLGGRKSESGWSEWSIYSVSLIIPIKRWPVGSCFFAYSAFSLIRMIFLSFLLASCVTGCCFCFFCLSFLSLFLALFPLPLSVTPLSLSLAFSRPCVQSHRVSHGKWNTHTLRHGKDTHVSHSRLTSKHSASLQYLQVLPSSASQLLLVLFFSFFHRTTSCPSLSPHLRLFHAHCVQWDAWLAIVSPFSLSLSPLNWNCFSFLPNCKIDRWFTLVTTGSSSVWIKGRWKCKFKRIEG